MTYLFVDTNVLLHYRRVEEIDWISLTKSKAVTIVLCPTVIRELDRHKVSHPQNKFRRRAQEIIASLHSKLSSESATSDVIRDGVKLAFLSEDPIVDFTLNKLRLELADDWFIASILEWRQNHPEDVTAAISADLGISIKAKHKGILTFVPLESDRLAEELDADEKRIKKLQEELAEIRSAQPILKICFKDSESVAKMKIESPIPIDLDEIEHQLRQLRSKHPLCQLPDESKGSLTRVQRLADLQKFLSKGEQIERFWPREEVIRYNSTVESFYAEYEGYLRAMHDYQNLMRRTIRLEVVLENTGSSPAEDVDINFHFPDGFQLFDAEEDELPKPPEPPEPPLKLGEFRIPNLDAVMNMGNYGIRPIAGPTNVSSPSIRRTNSYDVRSHIKRAKHGFQISVAKFVAVYDSYQDAKSFQIDYAILAANLPKATTDQLSVVLEKV